MTDVTYHRSRYDAPKQKGFMGVSTPVLLVCLLVVTLLFALLLFYLQQAKFKLKEFNYVDESVEVELVEPVPPPPPPPPPPATQTCPDGTVILATETCPAPPPPPPPPPPAPERG